MHNCAAAEGILLELAGDVSGFRPLSAQRYFYAHQPPPAAFPGTSNHGWGAAGDHKLLAGVFAWLARNAHRFGWSWDEGKRVGEQWHWRYVGGGDKALIRKWYKPNPLRVLTAHDRNLCDKLRSHRRGMKVEAKSGRGIKWQTHLRWARWYKKRIRARLDKYASDARKDFKKGLNGWKIDNRGLRRHVMALVFSGKL